MRIVFMGSPDFAVPSLRTLCERGFAPSLVVTQPPARRGRRSQPTPTPVGQAAAALGLPVLECADINAPEHVAALREARPDVAVVVAFGQMLRREVLTLAPHGCINLHPSDLPRWRGAAPVQWTILEGDPAAAICVMRLVRRMDAGPVLARLPWEIAPDATAGQALEQAAELGAGLVADVVARLAAGDIPPDHPQDESRVTLAPMLSKGDGALDFSQPAARVFNRWRAVTPWPRAVTWHQARAAPVSESEPAPAPTRLIVHTMERCDAPPLGGSDGSSVGSSGGDDARPGVVVRADGAGILIVCGDGGGVLLTSLQAEGRPPRSAAEFLNGHPVAPGDSFICPAGEDAG